MTIYLTHGGEDDEQGSMRSRTSSSRQFQTSSEFRQLKTSIQDPSTVRTDPSSPGRCGA